MTEQDNILYMCASTFIKILFLESKAIIKLFQKNIIRRHMHDESQIRLLMRIINRNNEHCYLMLSNKIRDNEIIIDKEESQERNTNNNNFNLFKVDVGSYELKKFCQQFQEIYYESVLYHFITTKLYNMPYEHNHLQFVEILTKVSSKTIKSMLSKIQLKIILCRIWI